MCCWCDMALLDIAGWLVSGQFDSADGGFDDSMGRLLAPGLGLIMY